MPNIGPVELVIILVIALLILGPGRLPDVGSALGKSIREFRKAATDVQESVKLDAPPATSASPAAPAAPTPAAPAPGVPAPAPAPVLPVNTLSAAAEPNTLTAAPAGEPIADAAAAVEAMPEPVVASPEPKT